MAAPIHPPLDNNDFLRIGDNVEQIHAVVTEQKGRNLKIGGRWVYDFASCNYLGFDLEEAMMDSIPPALRKWGTHPSWTRAVASPLIYEELEHELASLVGAESVLLFPTITMLHAGVLPLLAGDGGLILKDASVHRSVQDAGRLAKAFGAEVLRFAHDDINDLEKQLAIQPRQRTKIIAIDGIHSMFGSYPDLRRFSDLAKQYHAKIYIDDAHGIGVLGSGPKSEVPYGRGGSGIARHFQLDFEREAHLCRRRSLKGLLVFWLHHVYAGNKAFKSAAPFIFSGPIQRPVWQLV